MRALTLATSLALAGAVLALLYVWPPEWAVKLPLVLRYLSLGVPVLLLMLAPFPRLFTGAVVPALAVQVETLWLLCGNVFEPERFWVTTGALTWLLLARRDPLQAGLAAMVIVHGLVGGQDIFRGGYGLVGAAALISALLGSILWQVATKPR